ncbi:MAG TPA: ABC transporter ATP-binding protein [Acidiphilium sp.]
MITLDNLTKTFGPPENPVVAVDRVSMEVQQGDICILLGPSGCGKTTTLKMINRLIPKTSGKIFVGGRDTDALDAVELRRTMGYAIQQIGLFPNMTVEDNICVVPRLLKWSDATARRRAAELLEMVALDPAVFLRRYPRELSGGQQQRVGVARALAADPPVMIMDEPFGAIDPINREIIQDEFLRLQQTLRKTIMFVSHDIDEAAKMGDRIALFRNGRLEQFDTPNNVLAHPANGFVADFVGADRALKRLRLLFVREAVDGAAPAVDSTDPLDRAVQLMREHGHERIVVLDATRRPVGQLRLPIIEGCHGTCAERIEALQATVTPEDDLRIAVSRMFTHDTVWLVCIDGDGRFAGHVTQRGITRLLGKTHRAPAQAIPRESVA